MPSNATPAVGSVVPLSHLGAARFGTVVGRSWCESLGEVLRVHERTGSTGSVVLIYGEALAAVLIELGAAT